MSTDERLKMSWQHFLDMVALLFASMLELLRWQVEGLQLLDILPIEAYGLRGHAGRCTNVTLDDQLLARTCI